MSENMNMKKSECVEDETRELTLRINSMEENMELLKQRTTTCKRGNKKNYRVECLPLKKEWVSFT